MSESVAELHEKLALQRSQLDQVEQLLSSDSSNEQFINLRDDLALLISMTETLYTEALEREEGAAKTHGDQSSKAELAANSSITAQDLPVSNAADSNIPVAPIAVMSGAVAAGVGPIAKGDVVLVSGGERPFAAYVTGVISNAAVEGGNGVRVKYYEYEGVEVDLPLSSVTRMPVGPINATNRALLSSGTWSGQCKYSGDQLYYNAVITEVTPHGAKVMYPEFGNAEEVPLAYLRPNKEKSFKTSKITLPTSPVHPIIANFIFCLCSKVVYLFLENNIMRSIAVVIIFSLLITFSGLEANKKSNSNSFLGSEKTLPSKVT